MAEQPVRSSTNVQPITDAPGVISHVHCLSAAMDRLDARTEQGLLEDDLASTVPEPSYLRDLYCMHDRLRANISYLSTPLATTVNCHVAVRAV